MRGTNTLGRWTKTQCNRKYKTQKGDTYQSLKGRVYKNSNPEQTISHHLHNPTNPCGGAKLNCKKIRSIYCLAQDSDLRRWIMKSIANTVTKHIPTIHCNNNSKIKVISSQLVMFNHEGLRQIKPSQDLWVDAKSNILELAERNILEKKNS